MDLLYPARLIRNAFVHLSQFGMEATLLKVKEVVSKKQHNEFVYDDNSAYRQWIASTEERISKEEVDDKLESFNNNPKISILMPVWNVPLDLLEEAIESVINQHYPNWELCICDDYSTKTDTKKVLEKYKKLDKRIKVTYSTENNHISISTNKAFELSSGQYLLLMDNDDLVSPDCLYEYVKKLNIVGEADLIYSDEDKIDTKGNRFEPWFKPGPSPELLLSMMYPTHALYSRKIFENVGKMRKGYEGSQDFDLCLRVFEQTDKIYHIPKVLYHWRQIPGSTSIEMSGKSYAIVAAKKALENSLQRRRLKGEILGDGYPFRTRLEIIENPKVEIIIPTKDKLDYLKRCIKSVCKHTNYNNYSITIVNNNSKEKRTLRYFNRIVKKDYIKVLDYPKPYNFSAMNNLVVSKSKADYVLFLNNDIKVIGKGWLEEMLMWAQLEDIGAVGARLLFPNRTVQHAGVLLGLGGIANHAYYREIESTLRYYNHLNCVKNYSAVTAACLLINKKKFVEVGGFNEKDLAVAYNDIDLCLKLLGKGYRNVYTPFARLIHFESISRIKEPAATESKYMEKIWKDEIKNDPYFNPNFARNTWRSFIIDVKEEQDFE